MNRVNRLGIQTQPRNRCVGLLPCLIVLTITVSVGVGAVIALSFSNSGSPGTQLLSIDTGEAGTVKPSAETSAEVGRAERDQQFGSSHDDRAAEAQFPGQDGNEELRNKADELLRLFDQGNDQSQTLTAAAESLSALSSSSPTERAAAACSLGRLGAVGAIPALINLLGDDTPIQPIKCWEDDYWSPAYHTFQPASPGEQAAIALASLSAVEPLVGALSDSNPSVRRNAAWAIGDIRLSAGTNRSAAVEPLLIALHDLDPWVRVAAAFSLGELRPRRATESLIAGLGDAEWIVREMAAWALGGMKAKRAVENLTALLLHDADERVRRQAAWALGEIGEPLALESLTAALSDQDQRVRATAQRALLGMEMTNDKSQMENK